MTNVLILSKTKMQNGNCCIGVITIPEGIPLRLLSANGHYFKDDIGLEIRQIFSIRYVTPNNLIAPHIETVHVTSGNLVETLPRNETMLQRIQSLNFPIWHGVPQNLFEGLLKWQDNGRGYISRPEIPTNSVGFWISDKDLTHHVDGYGNNLYEYPDFFDTAVIKYVGFQIPADTIPAGTLLRVSLAKWWQKDANTEHRCYLQLSGWYDLP